MKLYYSPAYGLALHSFDTTRKAGWIAADLARRPVAGVELCAPASLDEAVLLAVHDRAYVDAVRIGSPRGLATSQGFTWDAGLWPMVLASNGGVVAAVQAALADGVAGSLSSGLHHARRDGGAGFCTFNGVVLGANAALAAGALNVLIVDLDAHCGGGTYSLIAGRQELWQLDVAVAGFDAYNPCGQHTLDIVREADAYLPTIARRLAALAKGGQKFDLCIYGAGMDPDERCDIGGLRGITPAILAERERLVFDWCRARGVPVAFVPAGGYTGDRLDEAALVALHRLTIEAAARG